MMGMMNRLLAAFLLGVLALGTVGIPVAQARTSTCRVRNVTQDTAGGSFARMVDAAVDGDRLTVRGRCLARYAIIDVDIIIRGVGDHRAILDAGGRYRALQVRRGAVVALRHLAVTGGAKSNESGGGILNRGTLTLTDSVVRDNWACCGGGIANQGTLTLTRSVVRDNGAFVFGGIENSGTLVLTDSVVRGNTASTSSGGGGGIYSSGTATLTGSVVRDNTATGHGGGGGIWIYAGTFTLIDSVVRGNTASIGGGGGINNGGALTLERSSSVTGNSTGTDGGGVFNTGTSPSAVVPR